MLNAGKAPIGRNKRYVFSSILLTATPRIAKLLAHLLFPEDFEMLDPSTLSRRERQIMDILFAQGEATVKQVQELLDDPPTVMAVRRMLQILEEKGHLNRKQDTREVVYRPRESRKAAGSNALKHVLDTFFGGAIDEALAAHFARKEEVSPEQLARLQQMIAHAKTGKNQRSKR